MASKSQRDRRAAPAEYEPCTARRFPDVYKGIYAKQVLEQMIFTRALALEADRLGMRVTNQELSDRIKQILPSAWNGDTWLKDRYATEVQYSRRHDRPGI